MKITQVSEKYGIPPDTLRYYERIGLLQPVNRTNSGVRDFSDLDLQRVEFIKCMRKAGLPVEVLVKYIDLVRQGDKTVEARKVILIEQRKLLANKMEEMQKTIDLLDYKINMYENAILKKEQEMIHTEE